MSGLVEEQARTEHGSTPSGRGVVVTGAARGLGRAIVETLVSEGRAVVLVDLAPEVENVADRLGHGHSAVVGDAGDPDVISRACLVAAELGDGCGAAVFNAGVTSPGETVGYPIEEWDRVMDVNLRGVFRGAQAARPHLRPGASMVMISSISASQGFAARASYCASKAGVDGLVRSLAMEWGPDRIRVNAVAPGSFATEMMRAMVESGRASTDLYLSRIPLGRLGDPSEIGNAVSFLLSDKASYVTGAVLPVDGGWAAAGLPASAGA
jgi:NAD(P)-dependent dehydrogenase (short-subunit alcohol dehydrogenase family)